MQTCIKSDTANLAGGVVPIPDGIPTQPYTGQTIMEAAFAKAKRMLAFCPAAAAPAVPAPYRPYPTYCLPPVLREFAEAVTASVGCDPCLAAMPALSLAGATAGLALVARIKDAHKEPPLLWTLGIADSGAGKSPASQPSVALAHRLTDGLDAEFERGTLAFEDASGRYAEDHKAWKANKNEGRDHGEEPQRPRPPEKEYFVTADATIERIIVDLLTSPRGLFLARDEFAGWFQGLTRYAQGGDDSCHWLSLFDGGPVSYRRRTGEPKEVRLPRTSVGLDGGIQPDVLANVLRDPKFIHSGLMARFLVAMPPKRVMKYSSADVTREEVDRFFAVLVGLRGIAYSPRVGPANVELDSAARRLFVTFYDTIGERNAGIDGGPMPAALSKITKYAVRLALVHHAVTEAAGGRDPSRSPIGTGSMAAGIELAEWHLREAERLYAYAGCTEEERGAARLLSLVPRKGGRITPRDLQRANGQTYPTADAARYALEDLVSAGRGAWQTEGGREVFLLTDLESEIDEGTKSADRGGSGRVGLSGVGSAAEPDPAYLPVGTVGLSGVGSAAEPDPAYLPAGTVGLSGVGSAPGVVVENGDGVGASGVRAVAIAG